MVVAFVVSLALTLLRLVFLEPILRMLGADETLMPYCVQYARATLLFVPFTVFGSIFQMSFITVGRAKLGLLVSVLGGVANILLDWLFISVFGWGLAGAAIATGIGYCIPSMIGIVRFCARRKELLQAVRPKWRPATILKSCTNRASEMVGMIAGSAYGAGNRYAGRSGRERGDRDCRLSEETSRYVRKGEKHCILS